jgi:RNA polymerase sigma factor (sigma-70 family)
MGEAAPVIESSTIDDRRLIDAIARERRRLRNFIRKHVPDVDDAEDILQDVFSELVEAARLMKPIEHVSGWLFRVARNRITDLLRRRRAQVSTNEPVAGDQAVRFEDLLPSADAGPEAAYARQVLLEELEAALDELPDEQRDVFLAHEVEGRSFKELAATTGVSVNTLLARKRYAVLRLRRRLEAIYKEFRNG